MKSNESSVTLILILWMAGLGAAAQFAKVAVVLTTLAEAYPHAGHLLGFALSLVGFVGIVLGVVAGVVVAQIPSKPLLCSAMLLGAGASLYQATLPPLPLFLVSRLIEGVSHLAIVVCVPTLIAQSSSDRNRGISMTFWGTFFGIGFAVTALLGTPLVSNYGLASLLLAHAIYMLVITAVLFVSLRSHPETQPKTDFSMHNIVHQHVSIYRSPTLSAPAIGWLFYTATFVALLTVLPSYVEPTQRLFTASALPLASIFTSMTVGVLMLRWMPAFRCVQLGLALALFVLIFIWATHSTVLLCVTLAGVLGLVQGASFAAVPQLNPERASQALANGAMAQTGNLGTTLGPPMMLTLAAAWNIEGILVFTGLLYISGIIAHQILFHQRRRQN